MTNELVIRSRPSLASQAHSLHSKASNQTRSAAMGKGLLRAGAAVGLIALLVGASRRYGFDGEAALRAFRALSERLGLWAIPVYVAAHTVTLALCLPYAVFFEAGASLLFGFLPAVLCVFSAKVLGASLSFWIGRAIFRRSKSAMGWAQNNKYFHLITRGVEHDGWKFVLLARFSPVPSYIINYALAATEVGFLVDFLLPTVIGGIPMIIQNTSIGSLAGAAVASTTGSKKPQVLSYLLPILGIASSILISLRIKKYSSGFATSVDLKSPLPGEKIVGDKTVAGSSSNGAPAGKGEVAKREN